MTQFHVRHVFLLPRSARVEGDDVARAKPSWTTVARRQQHFARSCSIFVPRERGERERERSLNFGLPTLPLRSLLRHFCHEYVVVLRSLLLRLAASDRWRWGANALRSKTRGARRLPAPCVHLTYHPVKLWTTSDPIYPLLMKVPEKRLCALFHANFQCQNGDSTSLFS